MFRSIRARLLVTYLLITGLGMMVVSGYLVYQFRESYIYRSKIELRHWGEKLAASLRTPLERGDRHRVEELVRAFPEPSWVTLRVYDPSGSLMVASDSAQRAEHRQFDESGVLTAIRERRMVEKDLPGMRPEAEKRFIAVPVMAEDGRELLGVVRLSLYPVDFERVFTQARRAAIAALLAAFALCAIVSLLVARGVARPVSEMSDFAEAIGGGRFGQHLRVSSRDEVGALAAQLNRMSDRLASSEQERREFLAAVSHELRTPVSNVQVTLESLIAGAAEEPATRERFLEAALSETGRLGGLINDLIDLARLEAGVVTMSHREVRLADVMNQAASAVEPRLMDRGLRLHIEVSRDLHVWGDPQRLLQVLMILLDNAIKFTPEGGEVRVSGSATRHSVEIRVADDGPGIAPEDLPHIFDRFYTADKSRARGATGTGLGLAIAHRIIESHSGRINAESSGDGGAKFVITLPR